MWSYFFGSGLVEPIDEIENPQAVGQVEILNELAGQFIAHGYDLKFLIRTITATRPISAEVLRIRKSKCRLPTWQCALLSPNNCLIAFV